MHPFFTFHVYTHSHPHTLSCLPCISPSPLSSLPPLLFSSFPDPTSGPPRRSCFLLPDWAYIAYMHTHRCAQTRAHTDTEPLWTDELPVNPAAAQYRPPSLSILEVRGWRGVCVCACAYRDTGSRAWKSVRTPLFRPAKYCMPLIFTCLNITAEALSRTCTSLAEDKINSVAQLSSNTGKRKSLLNILPIHTR